MKITGIIRKIKRNIDKTNPNSALVWIDDKSFLLTDPYYEYPNYIADIPDGLDLTVGMRISADTLPDNTQKLDGESIEILAQPCPENVDIVINRDGDEESRTVDFYELLDDLVYFFGSKLTGNADLLIRAKPCHYAMLVHLVDHHYCDCIRCEDAHFVLNNLSGRSVKIVAADFKKVELRIKIRPLT